MDSATGTVAAVQLRLRGDTLVQIENWRRSQPKIPSRSKAIRQLLERALGDPEQRVMGAAT
jgi:hypothetical protein